MQGKDRGRRQAQERQETVMFGKSLRFCHTEHLFEVVCKMVCVGMCCEEKVDEGLLLPENVREMFG